VTKRRIADLAFTALLGGVVVYVVATAQDWPRGARLFPTMVGALMAVLLVAQVVVSLIQARAAGPEATEPPLWPAVPAPVARRRALTTAATFLGMALAVWALGFPIGGPLAVGVYLFLVVRERILVSTLLTVGAFLVLWALSSLLNIPFPEPVVPFLTNPF
jgi:hypothetical protein